VNHWDVYYVDNWIILCFEGSLGRLLHWSFYYRICLGVSSVLDFLYQYKLFCNTKIFVT